MKITESKNGTINLTVNNTELRIMGEALDGYSDSIPTALAAEIGDWFEYKRLDEKFNRRPAYERTVAAVKAVFNRRRAPDSVAVTRLEP